jgi:hypothetical protein
MSELWKTGVGEKTQNKTNVSQSRREIMAVKNKYE